MNITEVRVKRLEQRSDRLRAFCSITIDEEFVVHDLRVINGRKGLFVAMPSRKLTDNCPSCGGKNHLRAAFCNDCGKELEKDRAREKKKSHVDVAHPIVTSCRDQIMEAVLEAYRQQCAEDGVEAEEPAAESDKKPDDRQDKSTESGTDSENNSRAQTDKGQQPADPENEPEDSDSAAEGGDIARDSSGSPEEQDNSRRGFGSGIF